MFFKIGVLKAFTYFTVESTCIGVSFKETPTQVFSREICEIKKKYLFYRKPPVAASVFSEEIKTERRKTQY